MTELIDSSRDALLKAGTTLFAEKGYDATTVKEICDTAGVNVSLVSYYFDGKEGLYRTCLDRFGKARLAAAQRLLQTPKSKEDFRVRLEMFIAEFFNAYLEDPEVTRLIHRECEIGATITEDIFRATFFKVYETLVEFFASAQKNHIISKDVDPAVAAPIFFGSFVHFTRVEPLSKKLTGKSLKDAKYRQELSDHMVHIVLHGLLSEAKGVSK